MPEVKDMTYHSSLAKNRASADIHMSIEQMDSSPYFKSVEVLDEDTRNIKGLYEKEMMKITKQLDDMARQKHHFQLQSEKHEALASELQNKLLQEEDRSNNIVNRANTLQRALHSSEKDLEDALAQATKASLIADARSQDRKIDELLRENMNFKKRYEAESLKRRDSEEKLQQLQHSMEFQSEIHRRESTDQQERFGAATSAILTLEEQLRRLEESSNAREAVLVAARDASIAELARYRQEMELSFSSTLIALRAQADADNSSFESVTNENRELLLSVAELNESNRKLQGQVAQLEHHVTSLEENLSLERERSAKHTKSLENKLKDVQDMLFDKLREINYIRSGSTPFRSSIDSHNNLAKDQHGRMSLIPPILPYHGVSARPASSNQNEVAGGTRASGTPPSQSPGLLQFESGPRPTHISNDGPTSRNDSSCGGRTRPASSLRPTSTVSLDYNNCTNSSTGDIRIQEVHKDGLYITIYNGGKKDVDFGAYMLQQNVGGHPVAVYRFPQRLNFQAGTSITVYSSSNDPILHQPPSSFVWAEQQKWGSGPECTSILCKPNGQAIAWATAAHRFGKIETGCGRATPNNNSSANAQCSSDSVRHTPSTISSTALITQSGAQSVTLTDERPAGRLARPTTGSGKTSSRSTQGHIGDSLSLLKHRSDLRQRLHATNIPVVASLGTMRRNGDVKASTNGTIRYGQTSPFYSPLQQDFVRASDERTTSLVHFA